MNLLLYATESDKNIKDVRSLVSYKLQGTCVCEIWSFHAITIPIAGFEHAVECSINTFS